MVEDSDQSDPLTKTVGYGGVVSLGGKEDGFLVCFNLVVRTKGLMIGSYSAYQTELSDRIIRLRDSERLTYRAIADLLIEEGYRSPRGFDLSPESVFSIYKKRKKRDTRLNDIPKVEIEDLEVVRFQQTF